jgi:hypothetical protein
MGPPVHLPLGQGERPAPDTPFHESVDEHIGAAHQQATQPGAAHDLREPFDAAVAAHRPGPGVADDEGPKPVRVAGGHPQADRTAPVLHHQRDIAQAELVEELFHHPGVLGDGVPVAGRCGG